MVISHTEHYLRHGQVVGWGPTVNEVDYLADHWDEVVHVACLYETPAPPSSVPYSRGNVRFVPIRPRGGRTLWRKMGIVFAMPAVLLVISKALRGATHVQFRAPTGVGVYLLPALSFLFKRSYRLWVKYAGDWGASKPPASYRFQRWWLKKNFAKCPVTINGCWPDQPKHCMSFENPCLTAEHISKGKTFQQFKRFRGPFRLTFAGRLDEDKGVHRIIEALKSIDLDMVERVDFIGDGPDRHKYEAECSFLGDRAHFHGFLDNAAVHRILSATHFLVLPSKSEGFPKVIAEAACYGGIPVVSDVGSIGHFVKDGTNGFLWKQTDGEPFSTVLKRALSADTNQLERDSRNVCSLAERFTFEHYRLKLESQVLN